ncbi:MAG: TIGR02281 family clan AA aspartic protease [Allosphingosinicella sp.]|uniref:retropepsin-like aspartic protease family protein n=1 Tax=Allosphingosinicella sp. TaxID=2823234 RepID=UPI0039506C40
MNEGDQAVHFIYLVGVLVLVVSAFAVRRIPIGQSLKMFAGWVLIFAAAFIVFTLKDDFLAFGQRVLVETRGEPVMEQGADAGEELRVRMSPDGHFWVTADLQGTSVRFLIDSGATTTSISRATADRAGIETLPGLPAMVRTANGVVTVERARAETLRVGGIERRDVGLHVSEAFGDMNVIGMNFLSSLSGWSVEGRTLILRP